MNTRTSSRPMSTPGNCILTCCDGVHASMIQRAIENGLSQTEDSIIMGMSMGRDLAKWSSDPPVWEIELNWGLNWKTEWKAN